jgi:hypothetical protein
VFPTSIRTIRRDFEYSPVMANNGNMCKFTRVSIVSYLLWSGRKFCGQIDLPKQRSLAPQFSTPIASI